MSNEPFQLEQFVNDPFATLREAQAEGWMVDAVPFPVVVRYDDVRELLADGRLHENFVEFLTLFGVTSGPFFEWMEKSPLNVDGDEHRRWRSLMSRTFTPRSVENLRPYLTKAAHELIDGFAGAGECDFVEAFADAYPSQGLCELIGVPHEDRDLFRQWANTIGLGFNPIELPANIERIDEAIASLLVYADELVALRRDDPRDDLVSRLALASEDDGGEVPPDLVRGSIAGLVFAGHETTKNQLGWMISVLADHVDVWDAVNNGELDATDVIEEVIRHRSTATNVARKVADPVEHRGTELAVDQRVLLSLWGANHDDRVFPHEDGFDIAANSGSPHLAFGHGPHHCLGAALARAELQEGLRALAARITCPVLGDGAEWKPLIGITGPERLPITFSSR